MHVQLLDTVIYALKTSELLLYLLINASRIILRAYICACSNYAGGRRGGIISVDLTRIINVVSLFL